VLLGKPDRHHLVLTGHTWLCCRRRDLDGRVGCENGVAGEARLANVFDAPSAVDGKAVVSCDGG